MRKRYGLFLLVLLLACAGYVYAAEEGKVYKLKLADSFPIGHPGHKVSKLLISNVQKASNGRIQIEHFPAQQLGKMQDLLKLCQGGLTDITYVAPSFFAGQLPLNTVMVLPFWTTAVEGTKIYRDLMKESPELLKELAKYKVRPIAVMATSQYDVGTVKTPVTKPEDLKGLRLKSSGGIFEKIAKRYGIIPITIPSPEVYEATQRGVVDGNIFSLPSVKGYRVDELEKYHTCGLRLGGFPAMYIINQKSWDKLPPDLQKIVAGVGDKLATFFAGYWDKTAMKRAGEYEKEGMKIYRIKKENRATWDAPLKGFEEEWIADMKKRGLPGRKVFELFKGKADQHTK